MTAHARAELPATERLRVTEIFHSLQGEAATVGHPTVFVRLTGCPLRCRYCDTAYAFFGGEWLTIDEVLAEAKRFDARYVCVTGGEPLAQPNCPRLLTRLCDEGYHVSIETSGSFPIAPLDERVVRVMDWKTPGSGEEMRNLPQNLRALRPQDQIKFVLCDRSDYEWACHVLAEQGLEKRCEVLFSPSYGQLEARDLAEWILADRLRVRFQIQLHKYLWGEARGR
jgi:7-carboxy-7-deazaguanine synthase